MLTGAVSIATGFMVDLLFPSGAQWSAVSKEHQTELLHALIHAAYTRSCMHPLDAPPLYTQKTRLTEGHQTACLVLSPSLTHIHTHTPHELCSALEESELPTNGAAVMPA